MLPTPNQFNAQRMHEVSSLVFSYKEKFTSAFKRYGLETNVRVFECEYEEKHRDAVRLAARELTIELHSVGWSRSVHTSSREADGEIMPI